MPIVYQIKSSFKLHKVHLFIYYLTNRIGVCMQILIENSSPSKFMISALFIFSLRFIFARFSLIFDLTPFLICLIFQSSRDSDSYSNALLSSKLDARKTTDVCYYILPMHSGCSISFPSSRNYIQMTHRYLQHEILSNICWKMKPPTLISEFIESGYLTPSIN